MCFFPDGFSIYTCKVEVCSQSNTLHNSYSSKMLTMTTRTKSNLFSRQNEICCQQHECITLNKTDEMQILLE